MASSAISFVLKNLGILIQNEVVLLWGVDVDMRNLSSTLSTILAVLDDAEMKQYQEKAIQNWLRKLKDAAYEVGDILDECQTEALKWESLRGQSSASLKKVWAYTTHYSGANLLIRHKIANRMKDVTEKINTIAEERKMFLLNEGFIGNGLQLADEIRETSSALPSLEVFGRRDDIEQIVKVLTKEVRDVEDFSVYPIIGMGGLGKSTLAQMIFNEKRIESHFVLKIWVYISQNFDVKRVMKQIIESTPGDKSEVSSLDSLQKEVKRRLSGKRYLLVLDDAWSEDQQEWDTLRHVLRCGSSGACVVVTTRKKKVALLVKTVPFIHTLSPLSEDDCWLLFRQRAFGAGNEERQELVAIGKQIVKKCDGVPLAAKSLGGLMRFRRGEKEWNSVKESDMWNVTEGESSILPALRLSYYNLPLELRHCFSYSAVFLKGSKIQKDKLIQLWMANGLIPSRDEMNLEDLGGMIWNELNLRSLFQHEEIDYMGNSYFKLHDFMHDLARFFMGDEGVVVEFGRTSSLPTRIIRHATVVAQGEHEGEVFPEALRTQRSLHTILLQHREPIRGKFKYSCNFDDFGSLRVFDACFSEMMHLSASVGNSKHLRYLNLSATKITKLPASICGLHNLQTLNLNNCSQLQMLPKKLKKLRDLRHLCLLGCEKLEETPSGFGSLTQLKTLNLFVVGKNKGRRLNELQHLELRGELLVKHLERVGDSTEAKEANLAGKRNLEIVKLCWNGVDARGLVLEQQRQVIDALQPHPNVQQLTIQSYGGKEFPDWMGNPSVLKSVVTITLEDCKNCLYLPAFEQLACLRRLYIFGMEKVEYIIPNGNNGIMVGFPSLEMLEISSLPSLKGFSMDEGEEEKIYQRLLFPRLNTLSTWGCPKLNFMTLPVTVESLAINTATLSSIPAFANLKSLLLRGSEVIYFPDDFLTLLTRLETLEIQGFRNLKVLPEDLSSLVALKELRIMLCDELECLPDGGIRSLTSLLEMDIYGCPKIVSLPDSIKSLNQLQSLYLYNCSPELERRCEKGKGEDWYKIVHVPTVTIDRTRRKRIKRALIYASLPNSNVHSFILGHYVTL